MKENEINFLYILHKNSNSMGKKCSKANSRRSLVWRQNAYVKERTKNGAVKEKGDREK